MAHDCPECYTQCHCGGDIDDINFGESADCKHYRKLECCGHREYCHDAKCPCHQYEEERFDEQARADYDPDEAMTDTAPAAKEEHAE